MKAISIWINEEDHKVAQDYAKREDMSFSQLVRKALREMLPKEGK